MDMVSVTLPASLYASIYDRFGEGSTEAIRTFLTQMLDATPSESQHSSKIQYPRPGRGTKTGRVWEVADLLCPGDERASRQEVIDECLAEGINVNTANTQYSHWSKAPLQGGGWMHAWASPDRSFRVLLLKLDLKCEPIGHPGIVVLADEDRATASVHEVKSLRRELPNLLSGFDREPAVYWRRISDAKERADTLSRLSPHPFFIG